MYVFINIILYLFKERHKIYVLRLGKILKKCIHYVYIINYEIFTVPHIGRDIYIILIKINLIFY